MFYTRIRLLYKDNNIARLIRLTFTDRADIPTNLLSVASMFTRPKNSTVPTKNTNYYANGLKSEIIRYFNYNIVHIDIYVFRSSTPLRRSPCRDNRIPCVARGGK